MQRPTQCHLDSARKDDEAGGNDDSITALERTIPFDERIVSPTQRHSESPSVPPDYKDLELDTWKTRKNALENYLNDLQSSVKSTSGMSAVQHSAHATTEQAQARPMTQGQRQNLAWHYQRTMMYRQRQIGMMFSRTFRVAFDLCPNYRLSYSTWSFS